nr:O-antigen polymerase [Thiocystis violacea]
MFSLILPIVFLLESGILVLFARDGYDPGFVRVVYVSAMLLLVLQLVRGHLVGRKRSWIHIDVLFLLMFFFVHFWTWFVMDVGGIMDVWEVRRYLHSANVAVAIAFLGMSAFVMAYNLATPKGDVKATFAVSSPGWRVLGLAMFFVGFVSWFLYFAIYGRAAFEGHYVGTSVGGIVATSLYLVHTILTKLGVVAVLISSTPRTRWSPLSLLVYALMAAILLSYLVQGDRSEFVFAAIVLLFAYDRYVKPISVKMSVAGILGVALLMSAVQVARTAETRSLAGIYDVFVNDRSAVSVEASADNIGQSGFVYLVAVSLVPKDIDFFKGELKLHELAGVLPFLRRLVLPEDAAPEFMTTSDFLTTVILGKNSATGTGTTIVADLYIDFGVAGVVVGLALLGALSRSLAERSVAENSPLVPILFCFFAGVMATLPRYSFLKVIRLLIWPLLILWFAGKFVPRQQVAAPSTQAPVR